MNNNYIVPAIFSVVLCLLVMGCKKDEMPYRPEASPFTVTVEGDKMNIPAAGDTLRLNIKAGANGWWIVIPEDKKNWAEPLNKRMFGSGDLTLPLIIRRNATGIARSVTVDINSSYNQPKVTFTFNQAK